MAGTDVETVRELARLALTEEELARLAPELGRVLGAFEALARAQTSDGSAEPAAEPRAAGGARPRRDEPQPSLPRDTLLAAAPASADGFFVVPKTVVPRDDGAPR